MKTSLPYIFISFLIFLLSCKKDTQISVNSLSYRYITLTKHKWSMTHEYNDSTSYAKNNLNLWPLSTTEDFMSIYDTCDWDSKNIFLTDGNWQLIKSTSCDPSVSSDVGKWKLINKDNDFVIVNQDTMHILELTDNDFKMWYKRYTSVGGAIILTEYTMWTFKSIN